MMQQQSRCPGCGSALAICTDMWGRFYVCEGCGFTAEDDDELTRTATRDVSLAHILEETDTRALARTGRPPAG